jgi:hypothetical protein
MKIQLLATLLMLALSALPLPALAQEGPTITGTLTVEDQNIPLTHVYAFKHDNAEGTRDNPKAITILLADRETTHDALEFFFHRHQRVHAGKLRGIVLEVDPAKKESFTGNLLYPPKRENLSLFSFTITNSEDHRFTDLKVTNGWISGTVRLAKDETIEGITPDDYPKSFRYEATFRTRILTPLPVTATLTGEQARSCPQAKASLAFHAAGKRGDMTATRKLATPETLQKWDAMEKQVGKAEYLKMWKEFWKHQPSTEAFRKTIVKVVVRGDRAALITKEQGTTGTQNLVRRNGRWVMADL